MRRPLAYAATLGVVVALTVCLNVGRAKDEAAGGPMIVHDVYFSLKDNSPQAREKLVAACKKHLTKHPGEVFFAAGPLAEEFNRPVNDRDFDVALHVVFETRADHDAYQDAPLHLRFVEENRANWAKVRVFDSEVERVPRG